MNFLSGRGAEELTVYGWNTKVSAPFGKPDTLLLYDWNMVNKYTRLDIEDR